MTQLGQPVGNRRDRGRDGKTMRARECNDEADRPDGPIIYVRKDGTTSVSWGPANGSRPPFREGNLMALKHGAFSDRMIEVVAADVGEELHKRLTQ